MRHSSDRAAVAPQAQGLLPQRSLHYGRLLPRFGFAAAAALALLAPAPRAQDIDVETWAQLLVDHPLAATGDRDRVAASWLELIREEPGHPLAEATLSLLARLQVDDVGDAQALAEQVAALDAAGLSPLAAHQLRRMQGNLAARRAPVEELGVDRHPGQLARFAVLGPLFPVDDPLAFRNPLPQLAEPGFARAHAGVEGEERWQPLLRSPLRECVVPDNVVEPVIGWGLVAATFDHPRGGPAWLELEFPPGPPDSALFGGAGGNGARSAPSLAFVVNDEPPRSVERIGTEQPSRRHLPVLLRAGRNRVVLQLRLDAYPAVALRVLGTDGQVLPNVQEVAPDDAPLGAVVAGTLPTVAPQDSEAFLEALTDRGPDTELLLGLLKFVDGRQAEGLAHVRAATDAAPGRMSLLAHLSRLTLNAGYLPDTWQRNRARDLANQVIAAQPEHLSMGVFLAGLLADEDEEEDAIAMLEALTARHQNQVASLFALQDTCKRLDMDARAESALLAAAGRQPDNPMVLQRLARFEAQHGRERRAAELQLQSMRRGGVTGRMLQSAAATWAELGQVEQALSLHAEAIARDDSPEFLLGLARYLIDLQRWADADALLAQHEARFPRALTASLLRADIALRRGDQAAEVAQLQEVLARRPSHRSARERLFVATGSEPTEDFFTSRMLDVDAVRAAWGGTASQDSVVKVLDHSIVQVFPDGGMETLTQDLWQARDLQGCEELGSLRVGGDVLRVATIKADGTVIEPVRVSGQYVMPSLKPGDFVVTVNRMWRGPPGNRVVRPGEWMFASTSHPFHISRYVISVPKSLPLRLVKRNADDIRHEQVDAGDAVVHQFEATDQARVLSEPGAPPQDWYLPWVEFGMDVNAVSARHALAAGVLDPTRVTPEIAAAADDALAGITGDEARARALHAFVNDRLDQRGYESATEALLSRQGNGTWLYAALLKAADVPHEIVWSRNVSPESDPEPAPPFVEMNFLSRKLLVLVQPRDGAPAWCDMDLKPMPYGRLTGDAPGAPALALPALREFTLPDLPLTERPAIALDLDVRIAGDCSATIAGRADFRAGLGYLLKEQVRDIPVAMHKLALNQIVAQVVPGLDIASFTLPGLDELDPPLGITVEGRVASYLDDDGDALTLKLPMLALDLSAQHAGSEGERKLPYFFSDPRVQSDSVRIELDEGLQFGALPTSHRAEFHGGTYELSFERTGERGLVIRRELLMAPFSIPAEEYPIFAAFCARIDEAERAQLRFTRMPGSTGAANAGNGAGSGAPAGTNGAPGSVDPPDAPR